MPPSSPVASSSRPLRLGLTGTIGAGKSTALAALAREGWQTLSSDDLVREELGELEVRAALRDRWGDAVLTPRGEVDRAAVAHRVFSDEGELAWLEKFLHPRVARAWRRAMAEENNRPSVIEVPLLYEKSLASDFDFVVTVTCPETVRFARLQLKGIDEAEARRRQSFQLSSGEKEARADFVLSNSGTPELMHRQVSQLCHRLCPDSH
jgi:dephospho-CoA kinase